MSATMMAQVATDALIMAPWRRGRVEMPPHCGVETARYASAKFQALLKAHGITCLMSGLGDLREFKPVQAGGSTDPLDRSKARNAVMASFFSLLNIERIRGRVHRSRNEARADLFGCIERLCTPPRRRSISGHSSPAGFGGVALQAWLAVHTSGGNSGLS